MRNKLPKLNLQFFGMQNPDLIEQKQQEIMQRMNAALKEGNEEDFTQVFTEFANNLQQSVISEARGVVANVDRQVLASRGVRQLTSEESTYYQKVIEAMKSSNPKQ